ncbi:MAG: hypothetical protein IPM34_08140 [Saprospiraceae bacterium]|nr:hypothetical protein [Saprospiraceae bacterium]
MKRFSLLFVSFFLFVSVGLQAQSVLPNLKSSEISKQLLGVELDNLKTAFNNNPSDAIESKLELYSLALSFLNEATIIPSTTDYAVTSAFLNHEVNRYGANDTEALMRFQRKHWRQEFNDLVNFLKL